MTIKIISPIQESVAALKKNKYFATLIKKYGLPDLKRGKNHFQALVSSIIFQQLSGKAAATIYNRFVALFGKRKKFPTPREVLRMPVKKLRSVGLSGQKARYLRDLAQKFSDGTIQYKILHRMSNQGIVDHLVQVKGIGEWTAHMFLIFTLNRPGILPTGDLGIKKGLQKIYGLKNLPSERTMERLAKPWRAHATVAAWYLWREADSQK
ncbi:MAG: DNA-3-methyladenine glycosylase [Candidatus Magasanikbacteria bacterium]|nr:DNA-3-methyladenine glycosylase [Candidatus Magasanikbacteria bacterium]